jgi:hypothetical protein
MELMEVQYSFKHASLLSGLASSGSNPNETASILRQIRNHIIGSNINKLQYTQNGLVAM